jgi:hypothetical protein
MNTISPSTLAAEAREALNRAPESPQEHFARLVRMGFINARGQVTHLLGGDAEPEPEQSGGPAPKQNGSSHQ